MTTTASACSTASSRACSPARSSILDEDGKVTYTELVPNIGQEPDYDAAVAALG